MKPITLSLFMFTFAVFISAQTADDILLKTQAAYRSLSNYVDEGLVVSTYSNSPGTDSAAYFLAFDRDRNVNFWFKKQFLGTTHGVSYVKTGSDSMGTYTRLGSTDPSFSCTMDEAAARAGGSGGHSFFWTGSLFYPDFMRASGSDSSMILRYDFARRLEDTLIHDFHCYVIQTQKTIIIPQELADRQNFVRDSTQGLLDLPPEQRGGPRTEAGPKISGRRYFIRQRDHMILRQEVYSFKTDGETISHKSILLMDPMYNVKDFGTYVKP